LFFDLKRFCPNIKRFPTGLFIESHKMKKMTSDNCSSIEKVTEDNNLQYYESYRLDESDPDHVIDWVSLNESVIDVKQLIDKAKTTK
jgi:hypothetical protein